MYASHDPGALLGANEVLVVTEIVTPEEQAVLADWADEQAAAGRLYKNPADQGGYLTAYQSADGVRTVFTREPAPSAGRQRFVYVQPADAMKSEPLPDVFWDIRDRVVERLQLQALDEDPYKGCFLSVMTSGGEVHRHIDAKIELDGAAFDVLRCNVLFRRPEGGGMPVIGASTLDIADRGMWAFYPTVLRHSGTEVAGRWTRGTLSFGFLVSAEQRAMRRYGLARAIANQFQLTSDEARTRFLQGLRRSPNAADLGGLRLALIDFVVRSADDFAVAEAAASLDAPVADVDAALIDLQRNDFVESASGRRWGEGALQVM
jgi:hypothetical protein